MLNSEQKAAVFYTDGPLLVLAGAGSGKTRVITQKIAHLIHECHYPARSIYALTFTNKAAKEMQQRMAYILPLDKRRGLKISTFHTLGLSILKKHTQLCGFQSGFSIWDADDCLQLIKNLVPPARIHEKDYLFSIMRHISDWKNSLLSPEDVLHAHVEDGVAIFYQQYQRALETYRAVDFDDLIRIPVSLLRNYSEIRYKWQETVRYLLVDEYQDSNHSQYELVKLLVGQRAQFTVVGDDDQSIYAWRGARPENLQQLQSDFPHLRVIKLEQNYRSTGHILHVANHLIANNNHLFEKKLWSVLGPGELIRVISCQNENDEAQRVVLDIQHHTLRHQTSLSDYAILYRSNHQSRVLEKILRQRGIPYTISGGQSWFAKTEIKDIFAYLRLLVNLDDDAAFLRIINTPKRGIGESTLTQLGEYAQSLGRSLYACADHFALQTRLSDKAYTQLLAFKTWFETFHAQSHSSAIIPMLKQLVATSGYETYLYDHSDTPAKAQKRMENVWELVAWIERLMAKKPTNTLGDVIHQLILMDMLENSEDGNMQALQLMTLHASKGLEFSHVYVVGLEEDILPHRVSIDEDSIEEERRLFYVGITRAQKTLCLTLSKQRRREGEMQAVMPSRFLDELPQDYLEWYGRGEPDEIKSKHLAKSHLADLKSLLGAS